MKKIFAVCMMMMIFAGCGGENISAKSDGSNTSLSKDKIVIGIDDEFAPIGFFENGEKKSSPNHE